ncbi:MAG: hypothetical protein ACRED0_12365 [Gammaproteobacteria bacterium]
MTKGWLPGVCLVQLAAMMACAASAQGLYPGDGSLYPPEIFDYCVELYGIPGSRAEQCMRYENQQKREAETLLQGEVGDLQMRERIFAKCYAEWGRKGMKWVNHCVQTEVSYHQIHGR